MQTLLPRRPDNGTDEVFSGSLVLSEIDEVLASKTKLFFDSFWHQEPFYRFIRCNTLQDRLLSQGDELLSALFPFHFCFLERYLK
jgi:hypothetical protein